MLTSSETFDNILDSIHSQADVDHLIAERIVYAKGLEAENMTKQIHFDDSTNSPNNVNYVTYELIDSVKDEKDLSNRELVEKDTCLMQDSQEDFNFIDDDYVLNEFIEGEVDNYSIELSIPYVHEEIDYQSIDKSETTELQDVPIQVAIEQEIEECIEEVVSDVILPEVYRVDEKIHTDTKFEIPIIKSSEQCVMQSELKLETPIIKAEERFTVQDEPKLVQDRTLICDTPATIQTIAEPMIEQQISLLDRALQGKLIPIKHASRRETLRSELVSNEIPTYIGSICRPHFKSPDKQNSLEGEISMEISPYINPIYRPLPNPPNIQNTKGERVWVLEKESLHYAESNYRPPPKPPDIPKLSKILLDLEMNLNIDYSQ